MNNEHVEEDDMRPFLSQQARGILVVPILLSLLAPSVQAEQRRAVYTGLFCQPHYPQDLASSAYQKFGSEIINVAEDLDFVHDLGMNCTINRSVFGRNARLKSVEVLLTDNSGDPDPFVHSNCHTHIEYDAGGSMNVIYGPDVYVPNPRRIRRLSNDRPPRNGASADQRRDL